MTDSLLGSIRTLRSTAWQWLVGVSVALLAASAPGLAYADAHMNGQDLQRLDGSDPVHADTQVVKLGFAAPLTGPQAHYGEDMRKGLELALAQANQQNIQLDGKIARFDLVSRDDRADPQIAVQVARQIVAQGVKGVLGHFNSGTSIPASRIYKEAGLPQIAMATAPEYTQQGYDTTFRMMASDTQQGAADGEFIVKNLGAWKVALIDDRSAYGQGLADEVAKAVKAAGGEVITREYTTSQAADFTAILASITPMNPDALFFGGMDVQAAPLRRQMVHLGVEAPLVSGDMTRSQTFLKLAGEAANGTYASLAGVPLPTMAAGEQFLKDYKARFDADPGVYAPYAYDGAWNMITAMKEAGSSDPAKYLPRLASLKRSGATNKHIAYDARGDLKEAAVTVYLVKDGTWTIYKSLVSQLAE